MQNDQYSEAQDKRSKRAKIESTKEQAVAEYDKYFEQQKANYVAPEVSVQFTDQDDDTVEVHMTVPYLGVKYAFNSVKTSDADRIYDELNSVSIVREKYASGNTVSKDATLARVTQLSSRFSKAEEQLHLYSGFTVWDEETEKFIGFCNGGGSEYQPNYSEIAFFNTVEAWSHRPQGYIGKPEDKQYKGAATVEIRALEQYHRTLMTKGYKVKDHDLGGINMTARIDNPGSWKAAAKNGFEVYDVDKNAKYGEHLRYQLKKPLI